MSEKTLIKVITGIAYAALAVPLAFSVYFYPSHAAPQTFLFRALVEAMLAVYLVLVIKNSAYLPKFSMLTWAVTVFMGVFAVASIFGENLMRSFFSDFDRHWGFLTVIHFYIFLLVLGSVFRDRQTWRSLFGVSVGVSVLVALHGVYQLVFQDVGRIYATIGNPAFLSTYLLLNAAIAWWCAGDKELPVVARRAFLAAACFTAVVALFTGTRAALLALAAGGVVAFLGYFFWRKHGEVKMLRRVFLYVTIAVALGAGVLFLFERGDFAQKMGLDRLVNISASDVTAKTRLSAWSAAIEGFRAAPLLGVGPENFNIVFNRYFDADFYTYEINETQFDRAHNIFFEMFATMGILGLLAYLGMFAVFAYEVHSRVKVGESDAREMAIIAAFITGYFVQGFFSMDVLTSFLPLFLVFAYFSQGLEKDDRSRNAASAMNFSDYIAAGAVICAVLAISWFANIKPAIANKAFSDADAMAKTAGVLAPEDTLRGAYDNYQKALGYRTFGQDTVRDAFAGFAVHFYQAFGANVSQEFKEKTLPDALAAAQENARDNPRNYLYYADLGKVYVIWYRVAGQADADTEALIAGVEALAPERLEVPLVLAQLALLKGNYADAVARANAGIARNPRFTDFYRIAFLGYNLMGDEERAFYVLDAGVKNGLALQSKKEMLWLAQRYEWAGREEEARMWFERAE